MGEIVVVEDDAGMRLAIERLLSAAGYTASFFPSAEALLQSDARRRAGCFIFDVRLPGLSGFELCERLSGEGLHPPVIFMTAHDEPRARARAEAASAVAYLTKPFDGRRLLDAVARALDGSGGTKVQ